MPLLAALLSSLSFTFMHMLFKRSRSLAADPFALTVPIGLLLPVWAVLFAVTVGGLGFAFNTELTYFLLSGTWAAIAVATLLIDVYLLRYMALSEFAAYRKSMLVGMAVLVDVVAFQEALNPTKMAGVALVLVAGLTLSCTRREAGLITLPPLRTALWLLLFGVLVSFQLTAYKKALLMQSSVLAHTALVQGFLALGFIAVRVAALGGKNASFMTGHRSLVTGHTTILALFFIGTLLEGFAYQKLSVAVVVVMSVTAASLFTVYDLVTREVRLSARSVMGLLALFGGIGLLLL